MIKKIVSRKLIITSAIVFAVLLIYMIPKNNLYTLNDVPQDLEYVNTNVNTHSIYLLNKNNLLAKTEVAIDNKDKEQISKELLDVLIKDNNGESKIPNGFNSFLPKETKILSVKIDNNLIKVDFSKELLSIEEKYEEKMIEAIVYTLTTIDNIDKVIIYVEGSVLSKLPNSKTILPSTLDRNIGINKVYDINSYRDIDKVTIYYLDKEKDKYYYVPVTKYLNDDRDKIKIIIEELTSSKTANTNLMSFLNSNTKLLASLVKDDKLMLEFNEYIFNDMDNLEILEEVIYTISLSVAANYDVKEVIFNVDNKEIYKSVLKTIE